MNKFFSSIIIITIMLILIPQKNGWSMEFMEKREEPQKQIDRPPYSDFQQRLPKQTKIDSLSATRNEEGLLPTENTTGYSGPQWGLCQKEIDYLFENSRDYVCVVEFGGPFKRLNQTWMHLLGWEIQELLGAPYINFVHPDDVEKTILYEKKFIPSGLINRYRCKDGSYRWLDWIGLSRTSEDLKTNTQDSPLAIARDITLQKVIENELQEKLKKISDDQWYTKQRILESITEIQYAHIRSIFYEEEQNKYSSNNDVLQVILQNLIKLSESAFGFVGDITSDQEEESTEVYYTWGGNFLLKKEEENLPNSTIMETQKKLEGILHNCIEVITSTKKPLFVNDIINCPEKIEILPEFPSLKSFCGVPIIIQGKVLGIIGLFNCMKCYNENFMELLNPIFLLSGRILNENKTLFIQKESEKLQQAQKQAEAENATKSSFLAHMSHEIRTPLTGLLGMLDLINKDDMREEDLNYLQTARSSGLSLLSILNDILDISKVEAGQLKMEAIQFNPVSVAQEVIGLLLLDAQKKEVNLKLVTSPQVPTYLIGDPTRLRQILFNLIGNAVKFTNQGMVLVSLDGKYKKNRFTLLGSVTDTGIGMPSEVQDKLFRAFSQADTSMLRRFGGTGLGLFITKKLCEMMGGNIKAISEVDKGSTFSFNVALGRAKELRLQVGYPMNLPNKLPNIRVLLVEDNEVGQLVLKTMLTRAGCSVTAAWNGQEAVRAVSNNPYDIVLMDGEMPVMDGFEATKKIRECFNKEDLPIIGVTAHAMIEDRERFLGVGMNGYLTKPVQVENLYAEILKCLCLKEKK